MEIITKSITSPKKIRVTVSPSDNQIRLKTNPTNPNKDLALKVCRMMQPDFEKLEKSMRGDMYFAEHVVQITLYNDSRSEKSVHRFSNEAVALCLL
jgi:hypothetical protein